MNPYEFEQHVSRRKDEVRLMGLTYATGGRPRSRRAHRRFLAALGEKMILLGGILVDEYEQMAIPAVELTEPLKLRQNGAGPSGC